MVLVLSACHPTRYVPEGEYLLKSDPVVKAGKELPSGILTDAVLLESNRKIAVSRFYLGLYNIGTNMRRDTSWLKRPLLKIDRLALLHDKITNGLINGIGEPPSLVDRNQILEDSISLKNTCFSNGFFHPEISIEVDTLTTLFRRETGMAKVTYLVDPGDRYLIRHLDLEVGGKFADDELEEVLGWNNSLLVEGAPYDQSLLIKERSRITDYMRNNGYFTFSPTLISFFVDTMTNDSGTGADISSGSKWMNVQVLVDSLPKPYTVSEIQLIVKSDASDLTGGNYSLDTIRADRLSPEEYQRLELTQKLLSDTIKMSFLINEELISRVNFNFLAARVHLREDEPYSQAQARLTQKRLQELGMLRFAAIKYQVNNRDSSIGVFLDLQMAPHYQVKAGMETFYNGLASIGNNIPSIGGNIGVRNRNTFDRSELLEFGLSGSVGFYSAEAEGSAFQSLYYGLGTQLSMNIPGLVIPFRSKRDFSALSPATLLGADVVLDQRQEYRRVKFGTKASYRWNHIPFSTQSVSEFTPLTLEYIDTDTDSTFQVDIVDKLPPAISRDFEQRISSRLQYAYTYQDYKTTRAHPTSWSKLAIEIGGNLPFLLDNFDFISTGTGDTSNSDQLLAGRLFYGQFVKASAEIKYMIPFRNKSDLVFRVFLGGSVPYNGTPAVPRESRFFSGGPSSMRGWRSNTLGPGTLSLEDLASENTEFTGSNGLSLIAPGGEWIFEANAEYRFDLFPPYFELGLFTDVGNVWFHNSSQIIEQVGKEAVISPENLKFGWDVGVGLRFDFDIFIFRVDFGQQLFAPDIGWIINSDGFKRLPEPSIGVDYPF